METHPDYISIPTINSISKIVERAIAPLNAQLQIINAKLNVVESKRPKKYYRNEDLKREYKFSNNTIIKYRENGVLPFTKIGDIYFYDINEINKTLKQNSSV